MAQPGFDADVLEAAVAAVREELAAAETAADLDSAWASLAEQLGDLPATGEATRLPRSPRWVKNGRDARDMQCWSRTGTQRKLAQYPTQFATLAVNRASSRTLST